MKSNAGEIFVGFCRSEFFMSGDIKKIADFKALEADGLLEGETDA